MPVTFKSRRKKLLMRMYNDMVDSYVECKKDSDKELVKDAKEWKSEFKELLKDL